MFLAHEDASWWDQLDPEASELRGTEEFVRPNSDFAAIEPYPPDPRVSVFVPSDSNLSMTYISTSLECMYKLFVLFAS